MANIYNSNKFKDQNIEQKIFFVIQWNEENFYCSTEFEDCIGYTADEINKLPYKHHSLILEDREEEIHNSVLNDFKNNDYSTCIDLEIVSKTGKNIWFREFISHSIRKNEKVLESTLFNISDFKNTEMQLNEIIDSKIKLNSSKDKLISIISHDLRAPFSSLLGFSEILLNESNLPESERNEYLQYIYDASKIQLEMVNHLLDWTRLQTGTMKFHPQRLDIKDIVDNCVSVLTGSTIRKNIKIIVKGKPGLFVNADERLIGQALTNLISNAVKFTPSGKSITIIIGLFKNNMVEVVVSDEGVGIDEEHQDKLFRIDSKYSKIGTEGEKGSGFGLALVKEIIEKHGGNIWFYSELNKGSEFHFTLPRLEDSLLIVEEHKDLQSLYKDLVKDKYNNYSLLFCDNGFEALNLIHDKMPSILITYHKMPLMNGIQLVSSLRKKDIHHKVQVIVLCNDLEENEKASYLKLKVRTFLPVNSSIEDIDQIISKSHF